MNRRGLILGLSALVAAPAIIRIPGLLMPIRPLQWGVYDIGFLGNTYTVEYVFTWHKYNGPRWEKRQEILVIRDGKLSLADGSEWKGIHALSQEPG